MDSGLSVLYHRVLWFNIKTTAAARGAENTDPSESKKESPLRYVPQAIVVWFRERWRAEKSKESKGSESKDGAPNKRTSDLAPTIAEATDETSE